MCDREYKLGAKSGLIPRHWARDTYGRAIPGLPTCDGAGQPPKTP